MHTIVRINRDFHDESVLIRPKMSSGVTSIGGKEVGAIGFGLMGECIIDS